MNTVRQYAASGKVNSPPRLHSSRCGDYDTPAFGFNQLPSDSVNLIHSKSTGKKMNQDSMPILQDEFSLIEQVVMQGDLSKLNPSQRVTYYRKVCESAGLNPYTNPFAYIMLNGKLTLYAKKDCTEQLRKIHGVSIEELEDKLVDDLYIVKAKAKDKTGRTDESTGAVTLGHLKGDAKANAIMKAETKAKRRVTLSICGMGWTDESEIDSIPNAQTVEVDFSTGEIKKQIPTIPAVSIPKIPNGPKLTEAQVTELTTILDDCDEKYKSWVYDYVKKTFDTDDLSGVNADMYERIKTAAVKNMNKNYETQRSEIEISPSVFDSETR